MVRDISLYAACERVSAERLVNSCTRRFLQAAPFPASKLKWHIMRRAPWLVRLAAGIVAAALTASGLACASPATQPADPSSSAAAVSREQPGNAVAAKLPQSGPVIALSPADVWAAAGEGVLHWDGRQWAFAELPKLNGAAIESFAAVSPDDIWAVGTFTGTADGDALLILHWDGRRWSHSYGTPQDRGILYAVAAAGKDVWAVGGTDSAFDSPAIMVHLTAGRWHAVPSPGRTSLTGLAMNGSSAGWAAGPAAGQAKGLLLHWNGKAWVPASAALPAGGSLQALSAGSGSGVWGVGNIDLSVASFSMYWTGRAWRTARVRWPTQSSDAVLEGVTSIPGGSAWALGYFGEPIPGDKTAIFRWSGNAWTVAWQLAEPAGYLAGIGVVSSTDAWSIGYICTATGNDGRCDKNQYLVLHWDGRTWNESWLPASFHPTG